MNTSFLSKGLLAALLIVALGASFDGLYAGCPGGACELKKASSGCADCTSKPKKASAGLEHGEGDIRLNPHEATVSTAGLSALQRARVPFTLLDARSGKYDDGSRIPGARSLNASSTERQIRRLLRSRRRLVVTYCSNLKCPASAMLVKKLRGMGYENVIEYPYGIQGWREAGLPTVTVGD